MSITPFILLPCGYIHTGVVRLIPLSLILARCTISSVFAKRVAPFLSQGNLSLGSSPPAANAHSFSNGNRTSRGLNRFLFSSSSSQCSFSHLQYALASYHDTPTTGAPRRAMPKRGSRQ